MSLRMAKLKETVRALGVLALVFLNFGHVPVAAGADLSAVSRAASFCGAPIDPLDVPGDEATSQCVACLIGAGLDLPPVPATLTLRFGKERVAYAAAPAAGAGPPPRRRGRGGGPRGRPPPRGARAAAPPRGAAARAATRLSLCREPRGSPRFSTGAAQARRPLSES